MMRRLLGAIALVSAVTAQSFVLAHEGHLHRVMGTVSTVDGSQLTVKTTDGKTVTVVLDTKTRITQGKTRVAASLLKVGDRIVADGADQKGTLIAAAVQVGTAPPTVAKK